MLTTVHPPFDTRIYHKEAVSLAKKYDVTVIAPSDGVIEQKTDNVRVITVKKPGSKLFHPLTLLRVFIEGMKQNCDVYHCHEPSSLLVAVILKLIKQKKVIYDAHEHFPLLISENSAFPTFLRPIVRIFASIWERLLLYFADVIITVDEVLALNYRKYHSAVCVISNYPPLHLIEELEPVDLTGQMIYVGGISKERGFYEMLHAAEMAHVPLVCVGDFTDEKNRSEIIQYLREHPSKNISFTGRLSHPDTLKHIAQSMAGMCILHPTPRFIDAVPIKLFEYMACGKPVIASDFPVVREVVEEGGCGVLVDPRNVEEISKVIQDLFNNPDIAKEMGKNGQRIVAGQYNWGRMEKKLLDLYESIA